MAWTSLSVESPAVKSSAADSIQIWVASFLRYLELRLELLGLEAREAGVHLLIISLLLVGTLICFAGFFILLIVPTGSVEQGLEYVRSAAEQAAEKGAKYSRRLNPYRREARRRFFGI